MNAPYEAIVLAAGRGSRLGGQTAAWPKALLPIGPRSKGDATETSFLRRQLELLRDLGVERIVVVVGYMRDRVTTELASWAPWVRFAINPTPEIETSGSLHSVQFAMRSEHGLFDGTRQTLVMDADIVYHRDVLRRILESPVETTLLACDRHRSSDEEVLVWGTHDAPRYLGKGLNETLVDGEPLIGEATGIVKFAPADHGLVRETINWMVGDPDAPDGSLAVSGFGPARRATEHEELSQRFMRYGRMRCVTFSGEELPFMEVDASDEYDYLREELYPRILDMETQE